MYSDEEKSMQTRKMWLIALGIFVAGLFGYAISNQLHEIIMLLKVIANG
jgi:hypothetical protein